MAAPQKSFSRAKMAERSLYLRIYLSWWRDEPCYPAASIDPADAERLLNKGHIRPILRGERLLGWMLTTEGLDAWAEMNAEDLRKRKGDFLITENGHPLRYRVGLMAWDEMCKKAQEKTEKLTDKQWRERAASINKNFKRCTRCGFEVALAEAAQYFSPAPRNRSGYQSWCRNCAREYYHNQRQHCKQYKEGTVHK